MLALKGRKVSRRALAFSPDGKVDYRDPQAGQCRVSYDWGVGKLNAVVCDLAGDIVIGDVDR